MKIYCKYNLFWIKSAKAEILKLILSSVIAFSRKTACRNLSLGWWMMDFHGTKSKLFIIYVVLDLRVTISCGSILIHDKTPKNCKKWKKLLQKNQFLAWKKYIHMKTLELQLLDPKLHKLWTICTLFHENPSCGPRERLRQAVFLENAITEDKSNLSKII